ncbi:MAG: SMP-30/gluconolactonase/LRE family protein [Chloroflexi bacterium]|nr:SMP-30/gluconolactonase/LRE family protein [Chloroflexota bacterium]
MPPDFDIRTEEFQKRVLAPSSRVEVVADGFKFIEGPVWFADEQALYFSDIFASKTMRWSAKDSVTVFHAETGRANGNTRDLEGGLVTAGHGRKNIWRTEKDKSVTVLADRWQGKRLHSPNDIVVKSDGTIWFTDPPYLPKHHERELPGTYVFRFDPKTTEVAPVADDLLLPNGLCFSPDERLLYIADSWRAHVRVFEVVEGKRLAKGRVFAEIHPGIPDGMRCDTEGRLYCTAGDGVQVFAPNGTLLGKVLLPKAPANCAFGGSKRNELFITAHDTLYHVALAATGAGWC